MRPFFNFCTAAAACALILGLFSSGCTEKKEESKKVIRIGHFPNVTHVQALVVRNMERYEKGWFEIFLPEYKFEWMTYNAGPSAMEAMFANSIDLTYVGPCPAINAFAKSRGTEVRIVSGAANGASALVVQPDKEFNSGADFIGATIATPQLGNTQDVACRAWLDNKGFNMNLQGGVFRDGGMSRKALAGLDVRLLPTANPDQLALFRQKKLDAVWTVEPWVTHLEQKANGKVLVSDDEAVTTVLAARVKWMKENPYVFSRLVEAHHALTEWIKENPEDAQAMVVDELSRITGTSVNPDVIKRAWKRLVLTNEVSIPGIKKFVNDARKAGLLKDDIDVDALVEIPLPSSGEE